MVRSVLAAAMLVGLSAGAVEAARYDFYYHAPGEALHGNPILDCRGVVADSPSNAFGACLAPMLKVAPADRCRTARPPQNNWRAHRVTPAGVKAYTLAYFHIRQLAPGARCVPSS